MNVVAIFSTRFSETFVSPHPFPFPRARQGVVKIFFFPRRKKEPSSGPSTSRLWNGSGPLYERTIITIPPAHLHGTPASSRMSLPSRLISSNSPDLHTRPTKTNTILSHSPSGFPEICSQHFLHAAKSRIDLFYILFHLRNDINRRWVVCGLKLWKFKQWLLRHHSCERYSNNIRYKHTPRRDNFSLTYM